MTPEEAKLWTTFRSYKRLVRQTEDFISESLAKVSNPYVACSFGKDSSVMLDLVLKQNPGVKVRFLRWRNETEMLSNYDEVIAEWGVLNLDQITLERDSLSDTRKERYDTGDEYDSYFIGFRRDESNGRRITLAAHGMFYRKKDAKVRISPVANWTTKDIAAYIIKNNIPTLDTYKAFGFDKRTTSRIPREDYGIREGALKMLKAKDITRFNQLIKNFPDAKNFI